LSGKYFALSGEASPTTAYEAETGRLVFRNPDPIEADIDDEILHFAFVDDRRLLTASALAGLRLTDLTAGRGGMGRGLPSSAAEDLRVLSSPDGHRVASEVTLHDGTFVVVL